MTVQATDPRSGLFRFLHHDTPLEWSGNVDERLEYIRTEKPAQEVAGRLATILRVPDEMLPPVLQEAERAYEEAQRAYEEAQRAYQEADRAREKAWRAREKARRAREEALRSTIPDPLTFALSLGPLPEGVTWRNGVLRFGP